MSFSSHSSLYSPLQILYEDNHLLVLDKPSGLLTQPSGTDLESLEEQAKQWIKESRGKPGNVFLQAVHRLDRAAMGVVLFAKTSKALGRLAAAMRERRVKKEYRALVEGRFDEKRGEQKEGVLEGYLLHEEYRAKVVSKETPGAKDARLSYRVVEERGGSRQGEETTSLLDIDLDTGRYHQIRAQFSSVGHPIVGDVKYGARGGVKGVKGLKGEGIALCHFRMEVPHPVTGEMCVFVSGYSILL